MPVNCKQYMSSDGCVYLYDFDKHECVGVRHGIKPPQDVKEQIRKELEEMDEIKKSVEKER